MSEDEKVLLQAAARVVLVGRPRLAGRPARPHRPAIPSP